MNDLIWRKNTFNVLTFFHKAHSNVNIWYHQDHASSNGFSNLHWICWQCHRHHIWNLCGLHDCSYDDKSKSSLWIFFRRSCSWNGIIMVLHCKMFENSRQKCSLVGTPDFNIYLFLQIASKKYELYWNTIRFK